MIEIFDWKPILRSDLQTRARETIEHIAEDLWHQDPLSQSVDLIADEALLFSYLARCNFSVEWEERCIQRLNHVSSRLGDDFHVSSLFGGLSGIGWIFNHVTELLNGDIDPDMSATGDDASEDAISEIDEVLLQRLRKPTTYETFDLISGYVGIGIYFLSRLPRPAALDAIELIVAKLAAWSETTESGGIAWRTPARLVAPDLRAQRPHGHFDLGVAHGVFGVLSFLTDILASEYEIPQAKPLVDGLLKWLPTTMRSESALSRFPVMLVDDHDTEDSRLGWCYGDLGAGAILQRTALRLNLPEWEGFANNLLINSAMRKDAMCAINDAPLCHGAFGVAHILNRSHQRTGNIRFLHLSNEWYERGFALQTTSGGVVGFPAYRPDLTPPLRDDRSLISGATGVALALLAATTQVPPMWDRMFLLS